MLVLIARGARSPGKAPVEHVGVESGYLLGLILFGPVLQTTRRRFVYQTQPPRPLREDPDNLPSPATSAAELTWASRLFNRWVADSDAKGPASTNQPAAAIAFQRWFPLKEAFSPKLVADIIAANPGPVRRCADPFGGSGTTALVCQFLGVEPTTIELNPFLGDLIEAKLSGFDLADLMSLYQAVRTRVRADRDDICRQLGEGAPATFCEPGVDERWIFGRLTFQRILAYRDAIDELCEGSSRSLFRSVLGGLLVPVSNVFVNGKGRRYRAASARRPDNPLNVNRLFAAGFERAFLDLAGFGMRRAQGFRLLRGDSRTLAYEIGEADLVISSPPYPNSFDYSDIYNLELWMLGYLRSREDNMALRRSTMRSHVQISRSFACGEWTGCSPTLDRVYTSLAQVRDRLWNPLIPEMVRAYFDDLLQVLSGCRAALRKGGRAVLAVGSSQYDGVLVDVARILAELAPSAHFAHLNTVTLRSMRTSAQQGGQASLNESLVTLRAC